MDHDSESLERGFQPRRALVVSVKKRECPRLRKKLLDDVGFFYAGQSLVEALKLDAQPLMVKSQLVQDRCVKVTDVDSIFGHVESKIIAFTHCHSGLHAATGHPHRERVGMMGRDRHCRHLGPSACGRIRLPKSRAFHPTSRALSSL